LRFQAFHQAINNQLIIFGRAQMAGDIFEGKKESRKVGELVELLDFGERRAFHAVALAEFEERGGLDRAFEMQMEFGLGQRERMRELGSRLVASMARMVVLLPSAF
jgi:hypothetical protein